MARYTLIVGTRNWSSWSLRPYVALKATGQPFETLDIHLRQTSLYNVLIMLVLLVGGVGLMMRSVLPMGKPAEEKA